MNARAFYVNILYVRVVCACERIYVNVKSFYSKVRAFYMKVGSFYMNVRSFYIYVNVFWGGGSVGAFCECERISCKSESV